MPVGKQSVIVEVMWPEKAHMEAWVDLPVLEFFWELQLVVGGFGESSEVLHSIPCTLDSPIQNLKTPEHAISYVSSIYATI
jgi:hypothetical protein